MRKSIKFVAVVFILIVATLGVFSVLNQIDDTFKANEGLVVYNPVNFRKEPSIKGKIIEKIPMGETVEVLEEVDDWLKIKYHKKVGYVISDSVSMKKVMFDISDYNWGSEYNSIDEFVDFTIRAQVSCRFAGYYVQVVRADEVNYNWQEIVDALDEMQVPYGLYMYTSASTKEDVESEYDIFEKATDGVNLEYNKYPFMIDLENGSDQTEVLKCVQSMYDDFIVYANASTMETYGYHELADQYWVAHYDIKNTIPAKDYEEHVKAIEGLDPDIWQFTDEGCEKLFGTNHLDINIISDEWYEKYI